MFCLRSKIAEAEYVFAMQDDDYYDVAILRAPAGGRLIGTMLERAAAIAAAEGGDMAFGSTGPNLFTEVVRELGFAGKATERTALYPIPYWQGLATCDPRRREEIERRVAESTFLHLWTGTFRGSRVPKTARPPAGSFLAAAYERFDVPFSTVTEFDWRTVLEPPPRGRAITRLPAGTGTFTPIDRG